MTVDFEFKRAPAWKVATFAWKGPWKDARIRTEFEKVAKWARGKGFKTGKWIFIGSGERRFRVAIEIKGKGRGEGSIHLRTIPASRVASIVFDPDEVSPRVAYHGMTDWLRWRRKYKEIRGTGMYREVYNGNPWTDAKASAHTEVQVVVR
ncbi:MAG: GyrI-like domain-containing protein [Thermoplasmata archaeon]|nr:GyrI-like domain-containing protein [Thermoplasmata archaeon]